MSKVLVSLTPQMLKALDHLVKEGLYASRSEAIRSAIRRLLHYDVEDDDFEEMVSESFPASDAGSPGWIYS